MSNDPKVKGYLVNNILTVSRKLFTWHVTEQNAFDIKYSGQERYTLDITHKKVLKTKVVWMAIASLLPDKVACV